MTEAIDASQALYNTWHDCTWSPGTEPYSVEIDFEGKLNILEICIRILIVIKLITTGGIRSGSICLLHTSKSS